MSYDVRFARVIDAAPEAVFDAFAQLGGQQAFYGTDDPGWIVETECDFRVGGVWAVTFGPSPGELYRHTDVFRVIDRPRRLLLDAAETGSTDRASSSRPNSPSSHRTGRP
jgi:uncharacterized protein YndB with AHSA1/START domain